MRHMTRSQLADSCTDWSEKSTYYSPEAAPLSRQKSRGSGTLSAQSNPTRDHRTPPRTPAAGEWRHAVRVHMAPQHLAVTVVPAFSDA
jgi:hypothetical protein